MLIKGYKMGKEERKLTKNQRRLEKQAKRNKKPLSRPKRVLDPKCINSEQQICLSSQGYFTPCCWFDDNLKRTEVWVRNFFEEHLHINNNNDIEDIFNSKEWTEFYDMIVNSPNSAPRTCWEMCGSNLITEKLLDTNDSIEVRIRH